MKMVQGARILDSEKVKELYLEKGWTPRRIAEHFGVTRTGVAQRLKRDGVISLRPRRVVDVDVGVLRRLYVDEGRSVEDTARNLGVSGSTVRRLLRREGIKLNRLSRVDAEEARRLYEDEGWTLKQIGERFGVSQQAVHIQLRRAGVNFRRGGPGRAKLDRERVIDLYVRQGLTLDETARHFGVTREPVRRLLVENGIERHSQGYRK